MALIKCKECSKKFSDQASACPNCGAPTPPPELTFMQELEQELERKRKLEEEELERISKLPDEERKAEEEKRENRRKKAKADNEKFITITLLSIMFIVVISVVSCSGSKKEAVAEKLTQEQIDENLLQSQFSSWDGSHPALVERVKKSMKNPDSFEHVETRFGWVNDPKYNPHEVIIVHMTYRGTNSFGGVVTEEISAHVDTYGNVREIL